MTECISCRHKFEFTEGGRPFFEHHVSEQSCVVDKSVALVGAAYSKTAYFAAMEAHVFEAYKTQVLHRSFRPTSTPKVTSIISRRRNPSPSGNV